MIEATATREVGRMLNWAGNYAFAAKRLHRPTSISKLQRLVASSQKIRAIGTRHSFNGVADTTGDLVDLSGLDTEIVIDRERMVVSIGAGASYAALGSRLHREGFALHNLASLLHISLAGAISTATHGSGDRNQTLSSAVAGVELVLSDGSLRHVVRGHPDFPGVVVGLGAFGVISRLTLDIVPTFEIQQDSFIDLPWDELVVNFDAISSAAYSFSIFTKWSKASTSRVWLKTRVGDTSSQASAELGDAALDHFFDIGLDRGVRRHRDRLSSGCSHQIDCLFDLIGAAPYNQHPGALCREAHRTRATYAGARAGDDRPCARQSHQRPLPWLDERGGVGRHGFTTRSTRQGPLVTVSR
jgi:FAD/FMN-containing dehydrogenase